MILPAPSGRQTVDLDAGWQMARVPAPPSLWSGPDAVPTAGWRVVSVSSEESAAENGRAVRAFDGDPRTFWHTEWSRRQASYPHVLTIDLGRPTEAVGVRLLPRQTGPQNGRPNHVRLFLDDVKAFEGAVPDTSALFEARFPPAKGRTLRIEFLDGHRPEPFLALAEIGLIRSTRQGTDWASQYAVARVETGDARFDPSPADIERLRRAELAQVGNWTPVTLPQPAWIRPLDNPSFWQGVAYYRRRLPAPPSGRRATLVLQGMQSVDVWLNGRHVAARRGGYLPLRVEIGEGGDLLVRVDSGDNPLIPPGKPQAELDFVYGNGIVGDARLEATDPMHITDPREVDLFLGGGIRVGPIHLQPHRASFEVSSSLRNSGARERSFVLRQVLRDPAGRIVAQAVLSETFPSHRVSRLSQNLIVTNPTLWSPDSPTLYRLRTTIEEHGRAVDAVKTAVGLRTIEVSRERGFLLNGKPLRLVGTNRHQDYPWVGPALSDAAEFRDALLIKRSGHNVVRLSHYDQSPAFLDACDRLGILTIPCIPGWQFVNHDARFEARVVRDIQELVRHDRNHPSVAFWEASLNETYPPAALAQTWHDVARMEGAGITAGDEGSDVPWEVTYNGWREDLSRPSNSARPGYIREYGDFEFGGATSTSRVRLRDGLDRLLDETWNHVWSVDRFRPQYPSTMGMGTWEMFDHDVPWDFAVSASGLADLMRREKPSFWFFASQQATKPYLKVAADWQNPFPLRGRGRRIVVFTNAPRASLFVNSRFVATAEATRGPVTSYDLRRQFDGTNTINLVHPPIVFRDVPFTPGTLRVVGSNGAADTQRTAGPAARLRVWVDDLGVAPTTNDLVFVRAAVVDAAGTVLPNESRVVRFSGADFAGEDHAACEAGIASVLVRTPLRHGDLHIRAAAGALAGMTELKLGPSRRRPVAGVQGTSPQARRPFGSLPFSWGTTSGERRKPPCRAARR